MADKVVTSLSDEYCKVREMRVERGKIHDYIGMTLDFSEEGKFVVNMEEYINERY